jgi:hypothetical protein
MPKYCVIIIHPEGVTDFRKDDNKNCYEHVQGFPETLLGNYPEARVIFDALYVLITDSFEDAKNMYLSLPHLEDEKELTKYLAKYEDEDEIELDDLQYWWCATSVKILAGDSVPQEYLTRARRERIEAGEEPGDDDDMENPDFPVERNGAAVEIVDM